MHYGCFVQKYISIWQTYFKKGACWLTIKDWKMNIHLYVLNEYKVFKACIISKYTTFERMLINQQEAVLGLPLGLIVPGHRAAQTSNILSSNHHTHSVL